uniref:Uncharacterized protein n=1 Tax=Trichuris muris TaxID=70415 RepID=A0A5S6QSX8_TRIMR
MRPRTTNLILPESALLKIADEYCNDKDGGLTIYRTSPCCLPYRLMSIALTMEQPSYVPEGTCTSLFTHPRILAEKKRTLFISFQNIPFRFSEATVIRPLTIRRIIL